MSHSLLASAEVDVVDADFGEALPVSLLLRVVLPALHLEDNDLVSESVLDDLTRDLGAGERRNTGANVLAIGAKQHIVELDGPAGFTHDGRNAVFLARLDTKLLAAGADESVRHGKARKRVT